jgi:hypothetical protein
MPDFAGGIVTELAVGFTDENLVHLDAFDSSRLLTGA